LANSSPTLWAKAQATAAEIFLILNTYVFSNVKNDDTMQPPADGAGEPITRMVWLVKIRLLDNKLDPWLLLTDWEVAIEAQALRIFQMYRQGWGVEKQLLANQQRQSSQLQG
jgi:hypothetical protein